MASLRLLDIGATVLPAAGCYAGRARLLPVWSHQLLIGESQLASGSTRQCSLPWKAPFLSLLSPFFLSSPRILCVVAETMSRALADGSTPPRARAQAPSSQSPAAGSAFTRAFARAGAAITFFLAPFCLNEKRAFELVEAESVVAPTSTSSRPTERVCEPASNAAVDSQTSSTPGSPPTFGRKFHAFSSPRTRLPRKPSYAPTRPTPPACSTSSSSPGSSRSSVFSTSTSETSTPPSSPELVRDALMPLAPSAKVDGHPLALDAGADTGALLRCIREQQSELLFLKSELAKRDEAHWVGLSFLSLSVTSSVSTSLTPALIAGRLFSESGSSRRFVVRPFWRKSAAVRSRPSPLALRNSRTFKRGTRKRWKSSKRSTNWRRRCAYQPLSVRLSRLRHGCLTLAGPPRCLHRGQDQACSG